MEITKVYKQANSLAVIIPKAIANKLNIERGDRIVWECINDREAVVIYKLHNNHAAVAQPGMRY